MENIRLHAVNATTADRDEKYLNFFIAKINDNDSKAIIL